MTKTLIIADDHPVFLVGIRTLVENCLDKYYSIIAEAHSSFDLLELLQSNRPDVLLTDFNMPGKDPLEGMELMTILRNRYPDLPVIVVTMLTNPGLISSLKESGVYAVINKKSLATKLTQCLEALYTDHKDRNSYKYSHKMLLSPRELEVVKFLAQGKSINEIAKIFDRSKQTISTQKANAMKKIGIRKNSDFMEYIRNVEF